MYLILCITHCVETQLVSFLNGWKSSQLECTEIPNDIVFFFFFKERITPLKELLPCIKISLGVVDVIGWFVRVKPNPALFHSLSLLRSASRSTSHSHLHSPWEWKICSGFVFVRQSLYSRTMNHFILRDSWMMLIRFSSQCLTAILPPDHLPFILFHSSCFPGQQNQ